MVGCGGSLATLLVVVVVVILIDRQYRMNKL